MSKRVMLAGLSHETHTFLDGIMPLEEWNITEGTALLDMAGDSSPLGGAIDTAREVGWELVPAAHIWAMPGPTADDRVVERFWEGCRDVLTQRGEELDAAFLILHGAMVSQSCDDVEGEILARLRGLCGQRMVIGGTLDLHGNYTARMAEHSDLLLAYRENPHIDARETAVRSVRLTDRLLRSGQRPTTVWQHPPLMWPPTGTGTQRDPMRALEAAAREIEGRRDEILAVNVMGGFSFADMPDTGVSFSAVTLGDPEEAKKELAALSEMALRRREEGNVLDTPVDEVLANLPRDVKGPIVIVEPSDNIGGGGPGDTTGLLRALLKYRIENAAVVINDPEAVAALSRIGIGERIRLNVGGKGSSLDEGPVPLEVELLFRSDGRFQLEDRQSHLASISGSSINMGPCATVRHGGIRILLTSKRTPPFDLGQLRSQGIVPETLSVIGVKAAVAHRRAYDPIAGVMLWADTPGPCSSNLRTFPYRKIRRPIYPLDTETYRATRDPQRDKPTSNRGRRPR